MRELGPLAARGGQEPGFTLAFAFHLSSLACNLYVLYPFHELGRVAASYNRSVCEAGYCGLVSEGASTRASKVWLNVSTERPGDVLEESSLAGASGQPKR